MKQKIKVMKQRLDISDEEIRSYMDFEGLIAMQKNAGGNPFHTFLKWGIPLLVIVGASYWILKQEQSSGSVETPSLPEQLPAVEPEKQPAPEVETPQPTKAVKEDTVTHQKKEAPPSSPVLESGKKSNALVTEQKETMYQQAEPVSGYAGLYEYFNKQLVYPVEALKDSIQGVLTVNFVITAEGNPEIVTISNSLGEPFEKEATRLILNMPPWKPAMLNGKPVSSRMSLPLTFQLHKIK